MITEFEFGPVHRMNIELVDDAWRHYGCFSSLPENVQDALQLMCHAIIQIADDIKRAKSGVFQIDAIFMIIIIKDNYYCINNIGNGMAVMNFCMENDNSCTIDFFSVKQLALTDPIISFALMDSYWSGRRT